VIVPGTSLLPDALLGVAYLLILFYLFLGIAVVADIFMESIEFITSKVTLIEFTDSDGKIQTVEKPVWNPTIANLTLMALGSSAPEILLSIVDVVTKIEETPSELGPQTIVGSAAFNMLVISAVSIMSVTEVKKIYDVGTFIVTSIAATWAYIWFFMVLVVISPGVVQLWEAILTLAFFLILVLLAYAADRHNAKSINKEEAKATLRRGVSKTGLRTLANKYGNFAILEAA